MSELPQFFLHFLNREVLRLYGFAELPDRRVACKRALTLARYALLLSDRPIIVPPAALFEMDFADEFLAALVPVSRCQLVYFASPTSDLGKYAMKKRNEYRDQMPLFNRYIIAAPTVAERSLRDLQWLPRVQKSASVEIGREWLDELDLKGGVVHAIAASRAGKFRKPSSKTERLLSLVPTRLDGRAFIADNVIPFLPNDLTSRESTNVAILISRAYVASFLDEYQAAVLIDTPFGNLDCGLRPKDAHGKRRMYSFRGARDVFKTLGIARGLGELNWSQIVEVRLSPIYAWIRAHVLEELSQPTGRLGAALVASRYTPPSSPAKRAGPIELYDNLFRIYDHVARILETPNHDQLEQFGRPSRYSGGIVGTKFECAPRAQQLPLWTAEERQMDLAPSFSAQSAADQLRLRATFGIITALEKEFTAVEVMLGQTVPGVAPGTGAGRRYAFAEVPTSDGRSHVVALAMMTDVGNDSAAIRAMQLQHHCPNVNHIIMCGIAGGIPNPERLDQYVHLGDVVICDQFGVIQYDFVKEEPDNVQSRHRPRPPSAELIEAVKFLRAGALKGRRPWEAFLSRGEKIEDGSRPDDSVDAQGSQIIYPQDQKRMVGLPRIFSGPIASANVLLKDPRHRDAIRRKFGVLAFEMESSGIADAAWTVGRSGYLTVRGICDYCDPAKGDVWQGYAAVSAAAYVRALIESIPGGETSRVEIQARPKASQPPAARDDPTDLYNELCGCGEALLDSGNVDLSTLLLGDLSQDARLGLTLAVRPSPEVAANFSVMVSGMRQACQSLFGYDATRFHFTVLSLVTAVESFRVENVPIDAYRSKIRDVFKLCPPFTLRFAGVCATRNSIIAMGFPTDHTLEHLRTELRDRLKAAGLDRGVDERYVIRGAHVVLARFTQRDEFSRLAAFLREQRATPLGAMTVESCQLAINDFYFSENKVRVVEHFSFANEPPLHNLPSSSLRFIGRQREHDLIVNELARSATPLVLASGFGGIGKSTLAVEVAWRYAALGKKHFEFIVWVDLRHYNTGDSVTLDHILNTIAFVIDPKGDIPSISHPDEKRRQVIRLLARNRSLLILDNYESVLETKDRDGEISRFIKAIPMESAGGVYVRMLITTRVVSPGLRELHGRIGVQNVTLAKLPEEHSIELMRGLSRGRSLSITDEQYKAVWQLTHGLPKYMQVAIDQLSVIPFGEWKKAIETVPDDLSQDQFFGDLFATSWQKVLTTDTKQLLMAMTYFVGDATFEALAATTGLTSGRFRQALYEASSAYLERVGENRYGMHPLTHSACRKFLRDSENAAFHNHAGHRFIEYFLRLAELAGQSVESDLLQQNLRNIVAAVQLASALKEWGLLAQFRPPLAGLLRTRGYWEEEKVIMELVCLASSEMNDLDGLATCLVDDLAWLYLRLEDLPNAEKYAGEGLSYFEKLRNRSGIAQALRQLGKAALLKGEYDASTDRGQTAQEFFDEADHHYTRSADLREQLQQDGSDQRERIADMKLDFGRLYWLRGRKYEFAARMDSPPPLGIIERAMKFYERARAVSEEALKTFTEVSSTRGIAKAWGNIGNAEKEAARCLAKSGFPDEASRRMQLALEHYEKSLENANLIHRRDEIAHACWGLAETLEFLSDHQGIDPAVQRKMLNDARSYAGQSHELYASLAGPRDISVTKELAARLNRALSTLPEKAVEK